MLPPRGSSAIDVRGIFDCLPQLEELSSIQAGELIGTSWGVWAVTLEKFPFTESSTTRSPAARPELDPNYVLHDSKGTAGIILTFWVLGFFGGDVSSDHLRHGWCLFPGRPALLHG